MEKYNSGWEKWKSGWEIEKVGWVWDEKLRDGTYSRDGEKVAKTGMEVSFGMEKSAKTGMESSVSGWEIEKSGMEVSFSKMSRDVTDPDIAWYDSQITI